jgi:polyisoprenoid-binding protein YceI
MNSLWADDEKLTGHLKSADFFNVEKFSQSTFELTCLKSVSDDNYQVSGNLTLNGTSKNITFPASAKIQGDMPNSTSTARTSTLFMQARLTT